MIKIWTLPRDKNCKNITSKVTESGISQETKKVKPDLSCSIKPAIFLLMDSHLNHLLYPFITKLYCCVVRKMKTFLLAFLLKTTLSPLMCVIESFFISPYLRRLFPPIQLLLFHLPADRRTLYLHLLHLLLCLHYNHLISFYESIAVASSHIIPLISIDVFKMWHSQCQNKISLISCVVQYHWASLFKSFS